MSRDATEDFTPSPPPPDGWLDRAVEAFVRAWREGEPRPIEAFLAEAPEGGSEVLCQRLVAEEVRLRLGSGETPDGDEYRRRFPAVSGSIGGLLEALFSTKAGSLSPAGDETTLLLRSGPAPAGTRDWTGMTLGDYRVIGRIGGGGMGAVYRAWHAYLDREVAVKVVLPDRQESRSAVERFFREMKAVGRLDHPNIVRSQDAREVEGVPFLVMELLEGRDLQHLVVERGPLPVPVACELIRQAALGLAHAHEKGLVHRDVKPSNLFLTDAGVVKVLDLGLSLLHIGDAEAGEEPHSIGSGLTLEGQALGTPDYMAPEQWNDALNADGRADLYGLGATLYFLLSGRPPFIGQGYSTYHGKMRGHLNDTPPALCSLRPEVPIALAAVVDRALSKAPGDRQATAAEFASAVAMFVEAVDFAAWLAGSAGPHGGRSGDETAVATATPSPSGPKQVDEDVQFTVYRPKAVVPEEWRPLLVFAHLAERRADAPADEPDPVAEVRRQAKQILGPAVDRFQPTTQESVEAVPRGDTLTFIPKAAGLEFNPPSRSCAWVESVHREEFRFKAARELDGQTARGRVTVYLGQMILAEIPIKIRVDAAHVEPADEPLEPAAGRRFRRIYASFAAEDRPIAEEFEGFARLMGDEYTLGCASLRTADVWDARVKERIDQADVFQLFWSSRSLASPQVEREWQYALGLNRSEFIRPVYWEEPLPSDPSRDLPPEALKICDFQRLVRAEPPAPAVPAEPDGESQVIGGRYRLGEAVGSRQWEAEDLRDGATVLVEAVGPEAGRNRDALESLRRDCDRLAPVRCPALAKPLAVLTEGGTIYVVQEYARGERLSEFLRRRGPLHPDVALPIVEGICQAIGAAHGAGVVHGDLKPHNVILAGVGGEVKVVGLGREALRQGRSSQAMTVYQPPAVSIPHAAPEVMMGEPASPEGDIFSIGAILFEALTGGPLATSPFERIQNLQKPAPRIRERNPSARVSRAIEDVVLRCMEFDPSRRYGSAAELAGALAEAASEAPSPVLAPARSAGFEADRFVPMPEPGPARRPPEPGPPAEILPMPTRSHAPARSMRRGAAILAGGLAIALVASPLVVQRFAGNARPSAVPSQSKVASAVPDPGGEVAKVGRGGGVLAKGEPEEAFKADPERPGEIGPMMAVVGDPEPPAPTSVGAHPVDNGPPPIPPPPTKVAAMPPVPVPPKADAAKPIAFEPLPGAGLKDGHPRALRARLPGRPEDALALEVFLIRVEGDTFAMGADDRIPGIPEAELPRPRHKVQLSDFYIQDAEVTNAQLAAYFEATGMPVDGRPPLWREAIERLKAAKEDWGRHPAVGVPWETARAFARWISPGTGDLPTEAQWEFVARSEGEDRQRIGSRPVQPGDARIGINVGEMPARTATVRSYARDVNEDGVFDLIGNAREWCRDVLSPYPSRGETRRDPFADDPSRAILPFRRVIRGGSFRSLAGDLRAQAPRYPVAPRDRATLDELREKGAAADVGFRIVVEPGRKD